MKFKTGAHRGIAVILNILVLLSFAVTNLQGISFAAINDDYDVKPLIYFDYVRGWRLTGPDYSQSVDFWETPNNAYLNPFVIPAQRVDDNNFATFESNFKANYKLEINLNGGQHQNEGYPSGFNVFSIDHLEYVPEKSTGENKVYEIIPDTSHSFAWVSEDKAPCHFYISVPQPSSPDTPDVIRWRVVGASVIEALAGQVKVILPETRDFGMGNPAAAQSYASEIAANYTQIDLFRKTPNKWESYNIVSVEYSTMGADSIGHFAMYEAKLEYNFYWDSSVTPQNNESKVSFFLLVYAPVSPEVHDVTRWRLAGTNGTSDEAIDNNSYPEIISDEPNFTLETLRSMYPNIELYRNTALKWESYEIKSLTKLEEKASNGSDLYEITLENTYYWSNDDKIVFRVAVAEAVDHYNLHAWRMVKNGNPVDGTKYNDSEIVNLPDMISSDQYDSYGAVIKENYTFEADFRINNVDTQFQQFDIDRVVYNGVVGGGKVEYIVVTKGSFYWFWDPYPLAVFRVTVTDPSATGGGAFEIEAWGPLETGAAFTGTAPNPNIWREESIVVNGHVIGPTLYERTLAKRFDRLAMWGYPDDWNHLTWIDHFEYDAARTAAENQSGKYAKEVFAYRIYTRDEIKWRNEVSVPELKGKIAVLYLIVEQDLNAVEAGQIVKSGVPAGDDDNIDVDITEITTENNAKRVFVVWPDKYGYDEFDDEMQAAFCGRFGEGCEYDRIARTTVDDTWSEYEISSIVYDEDMTREKCFRDQDCWVFRVEGKNPVNGVTYYIVVYQQYTPDAMTGDLSHYTVKPNEPANITMNLFDYWAAGNTQYDRDEAGNPWNSVYDWENNDGLISDRFNRGINWGHALKFFHTSPTEGDVDPYSDAWNDVKSYGLWNHCTTNARQNLVNIVRNSLVEGYPVLNLDQSSQDPWKDYASSDANKLREAVTPALRTESLRYLFDPTVQHAGKVSYADVTGLLQMNQSGYYYYDSKLNFAEFDTGSSNNAFKLYKSWGVIPSGTSPHGQFFPFNSAQDVYSGYTTNPVTLEQKPYQKTYAEMNSRNAQMNHHFGFTMEVNFQQPVDGRVNHGTEDAEDMTFKFAGDDDIWVFVDGVLVLDMGGTHSGVYGEINFSTGEVKTGLMDYTVGEGVAMSVQWTEDNLYDLYEAAGKTSSVAWNNMDYNSNTRADEQIIYANGTIHTLKLFYMERGHWDSNFAMYFNLQSVVDNKIYKVDEDGTPLPGAKFTLYEAEPLSNYDESLSRHTASEFKKTDPDHPLLRLEQSDRNGSVLLDTDTKDFDFASRAAEGKVYYIMDEVDAPVGFRQLTKQIVLKYDAQKNVFRVINQYESGAYSSFTAILEDNSDHLYYAVTTVSENGEDKDLTIQPSEVDDPDNPGQTMFERVPDDRQRNALLFAVPLMYANLGSGEQWYPIYGSNTEGYHAVNIYTPEDYWLSDDCKTENGGVGEDKKNEEVGKQAAERWALRHNLLAAALRQTGDTKAPDWFFQCGTVSNSTTSDKVSLVRFEATLINLPGDADRYLVNSQDESGSINGADLCLVGLLVDAEALNSLITLNAVRAYAQNNEYTGTILTSNDALEYIKLLDDDGKYDLLQRYLWGELGEKFGEDELSFENAWDKENDKAVPVWSRLKEMLNTAYLSGDSSMDARDRGVNLVYISSFTRNYGSVIYVPNERRELRVLKQDTEGNPLQGAVFGLFRSFSDAVNYQTSSDSLIASGETGENGLLVFATEEDEYAREEGCGFAELTEDWGEYVKAPADDNYLWVREISAPDGYDINESIVQVYVGNLTIYANASAYKPGDDGSPVLIDQYDASTTTVNELQSGIGSTDGVYVLASVGKLFQSMEKFADPLLNSTFLDVDAKDYLYFTGNGAEFEEPVINDYGSVTNWSSGMNALMRLHFWDRRVLKYTSSDYSTAHQMDDYGDPIDGETFAMTQNGFIWMCPTQTSRSYFAVLHEGETGALTARRDSLFMDEAETQPLDISGVFSPVNIIVVQDERTVEEPPEDRGPAYLIPSIGGGGTEIFYLLGGILLLGSLVTYAVIIKKKKAA